MRKTQREKLADAFEKATRRIEEQRRREEQREAQRKAKQQALKEVKKQTVKKVKRAIKVRSIKKESAKFIKKLQTREKMEALGEEAERQAFARPNNLSIGDPFEFLQNNRPLTQREAIRATPATRAQAKKQAARQAMQKASREAAMERMQRIMSDDFVPQILPALSREQIARERQKKNKEDDKLKPLRMDKNNRWRTASGRLASAARIAEEERRLDSLALMAVQKKLPKLTFSEKLNKDHKFAYKADIRAATFDDFTGKSIKEEYSVFRPLDSHEDGIYLSDWTRRKSSRWTETTTNKNKPRSLLKFYASRKIVPSDEGTQALMFDLPMLWFGYEMVYNVSPNKLKIVGVKVIPVVDLTLPIIQTKLYGVLTYHLENQEAPNVTNDCIPQAIESIMKKKTPKDLLKQLNIKTRQDGVTAVQLIDFCENNDIQLGLCDIAYNVLYLGDTQTTRAARALTLYGIIQTDVINGEQIGHLYLLTNQAVIKMIFTQQTKTNVKKPRALACKECNIKFKSSFQHSEHMLTHSKLAVVYCADIMEEAKKYINTTGKIPRFSINGKQFFTSSERYVESVPHGFMYKDEKYQSITRFATTILSDLYEDEYLSTLNQTTQDIFDQSTTPCVIPRATDGISYEYDITRCYTSVLYNYKMPVFSVLDEPQPFSGNMEEGAFYGVSQSQAILKGDAADAAVGVSPQITWLIGDLVLLYLSQQTLAFSQIKYQLIPHKTICFKKYIDFILKNENLSDSEKKQTINNLIGALSHNTHVTKHRPIITSSSSDFTHVCEHAEQNNIKCESFVLQWPDIMLNMLSDQTEKNINARPIWHFIVQTGRSLVEKTAHYITQQGGTVDAINTDAIYTAEPHDLPALFIDEQNPGDVPRQQYDSKEPWLGVSPGQWKPVKKGFIKAGKKYTQKPAPITYDTYENHNLEYNTIKTLNAQHGALITGAPGTGKSTLWRNFKQSILKTQTTTKAIIANKDHTKGAHNGVKKGETYYTTKTISNVAELSFQNNVVANIGPEARTFHKAFKLVKQSKHAGCLLNKAFKDIKYIFIDEIQQTPDNIIPLLTWLKDNLNIKFYCAGDFDQWLSIKNPFSEGANWLKYITDNNKLTLTINHRNPDMHNIHGWTLSEASSITTTKYHIAYTNREVYNINETLYKEFREKDNEIPFVCCKGNKSLRLIKGRHYLLVDRKLILDPAFHSDIFEMSYAPELGQYFTLGYAFTCHKTIGLTITAKYTIHDCLMKKQTTRYDYVARSRAVDKKNIFQIGYCR